MTTNDMQKRIERQLKKEEIYILLSNSPKEKKFHEDRACVLFLQLYRLATQICSGFDTAMEERIEIR